MFFLAIISFIPLCFISLAAITYLFAAITWIRELFKSFALSPDKSTTTINTALYCGRVSHTRYQPLVHAFSYPLFFCLLDLSEVELLFQNENRRQNVSKPKLWPLNILMTFRDEDHFKNGEGLVRISNDKNDDVDNTLPCRVRRLVSERTGGKCNPSPDQKIYILTHLCYYGYCFNPVSFYYILKENQRDDGMTTPEEENIEAIVAEVSNTPWNEMKCYVLHPDSSDMETVKQGRTRKFNEKIVEGSNNIHEEASEKNQKKGDWKSMNYIFKKKFHVSPFMEMDYMYDWTFWQLKKDRIIANTSMTREKGDTKLPSKEGRMIKCFSASFDIRRSPFTPFSLCYQLVKFPIYCMIIQIWIHIEALKLFIKGVEFIPHPEGAETKASLIIATLMEPFFALKDKLSSKGAKEEESKQKLE